MESLASRDAVITKFNIVRNGNARLVEHQLARRNKTREKQQTITNLIKIHVQNITSDSDIVISTLFHWL